MSITLRQYQIDGINLIKEKKNFGIFWQQRLGKTIVAIKSVEDYKKVIFAVPNNTILHWFTEIIENVVVNNLTILPKTKAKRFQTYKNFNQSEQMWIIASYDSISQDLYHDPNLIDQYDYLILDEAHFLRNHKSQRTKGINKLRLKAKYALALSGTPAVNSPIDLLRILKFLFPESNYSHKYIYKKKYFYPAKQKNSKKIVWELRPEMKEEWKKFINNMCDIKNVYDYLKWLPKTINKNIELEMGTEQRKHYDKMLLESKRIILNNKQNKEKIENNTMTQIIRLQQICLDPHILNINAPSVKLEWLENFLEELLNEDENEFVIVFTNFSSLYYQWNLEITKKFNCAYLTGKQSDTERQNIIHDFQSRKIRVLFTNIKLAGLGLTLDEATCTIFLDKSWNPVNNEQASFRMVDTKQKAYNKPKLNINVICANSIDDKINEVLNNKKSNTNIIYELEKYLLDE